jgi:hypothetical protein
MRRHVALILVVGLVFGAIAGPALAKKKKKKKPVPVDLTYFIVWNGEGCALSQTTDQASTEDACADPFAGMMGDALGTGPFLMPALEGLPLTLDAAKPIKGKISAQSFYLVGAGPDVMGIGQAQLEVKLSGTSGGEEVVIGELTTEPYTVTPASADYVVEFEIQPAPELAGKVFDDLTLSLELTGNQMFHGVLPADGTSTLILGAFAIP